MTPEAIFEKVSADQKWLEKAILALHRESCWMEEDEKLGNYLSTWIKNGLRNGRKLGETLKNKTWVSKARFLAQKYILFLLQLVYEKSLRMLDKLKKQLEFWEAQREETQRHLEGYK